MTFNPHTEADRKAMLEAIGVDSVEDLVLSVPEDVRFPRMPLPPALTEMEAAARMKELASRNVTPNDGNVFLGAGSYHHYVPATVGQILSRGEVYTAYTPYQPEVAQGTLQTIYEFQTLVAALFGMEVANASLYDGATALAEAVLMAAGAARGRKRIVLMGTIHPHYEQVVDLYLRGLDFELEVIPAPDQGFQLGPDALAGRIGEDTVAVVVQYPNFYGSIEDLAGYEAAIHAVGAQFIVATYPVPLGLLKPPGEFNADIVVAEGQSLGVAQSFGGPYVGLMATRKQYVRQMPGRLSGIAYDSEGKRGFVLTLQTREQHIRREKATSNICTNQGLMATAATVYMASVGPEGFREVAERSYQNAHYLAAQLSRLPGYDVATSGEFFNEFVVRTPVAAAEVNRRLAAAGIIGGYDLGKARAGWENYLLLAATEVNSRASIDKLVDALR